MQEHLQIKIQKRRRKPNEEILEFHKILEMLANLSANEITREKVRTIVPCSDLAEARTELEKTNDAFQLSVQFGAPPFHAFQDMRMGLRRAKSGARLSLKDLLEPLPAFLLPSPGKGCPDHPIPAYPGNFPDWI